MARKPSLIVLPGRAERSIVDALLFHLSKRDIDTLRRVHERLKQSDSLELVQISLSDLVSRLPLVIPADKRKSQPLRSLLYAILYMFRGNNSKRIKIDAFAREVQKIVTITFSRTLTVLEVDDRGPHNPGRYQVPNYRESKSTAAIAQDIRRGLAYYGDQLWCELCVALLWWRDHSGDPSWGFLIGATPHILMIPKKPAVLFGWIDDWRKSVGLEK